MCSGVSKKERKDGSNRQAESESLRLQLKNVILFPWQPNELSQIKNCLIISIWSDKDNGIVRITELISFIFDMPVVGFNVSLIQEFYE